MMATAIRKNTTEAPGAPGSRGADTALRVGWAVRNRVGQVVVIYEGATAQAVAQEWASDRDYTVEAVAL